MKRHIFAKLVDEGLMKVGDGYRAKNSELGGTGLVFLRSAYLQDSGFRLDEPDRFQISEPGKFGDKVACRGDSVITTKGNSTGRVGYVNGTVEGAVYSPHLSYWRSMDHQKIDPRFLYYWSRCAEFLGQLGGLAFSTDMAPYLSLRDQLRLEISLPEIGIQQEIAVTLGALDDKIELNRRMSATLEEMARTLYRSWFVDFDPVHARALGQPPAHMDPATAALFPDSFGPDGLPKGWEFSSVNDIFDVVMGQSPPGNTYNDDGDGLPFFQGRTDFGFRYPENRKFCSAPSRIAEAESVLLSVRAPVGDLNRAWEKCCIGRGVASLSEKAGRTSFGYYTMWSLSAELLSYDSEGTVFGAINKKQLLGLSSVAASTTLRDLFEEMAAPIDSRVRNLTAEARTLAALRDTLLPRLMSGELRIRDAEKHVEEAL